jgi:hypothetical protein
MGGLTLRIIVAAALLAAVGLSGASAQQQTVRVRRTIEKVDGNAVVVKAAGGAERR